MRRFVRSSAFALAAALGVATACAAWQSGGPLRSARLAKPRVPAVSFVPAAPADGSEAQRATLDSSHPGDARCDEVGCASGLTEAVEFCSACFDRTDLAPSGLDEFGNTARNQPRRIRCRVSRRSASRAPGQYWARPCGRPGARNLNRSDADDGVRDGRMVGSEKATAAVDVAPEAVRMLAGVTRATCARPPERFRPRPRRSLRVLWPRPGSSTRTELFIGFDKSARPLRSTLAKPVVGAQRT